MRKAEDWFEVIQHKKYLYVIRERLDEIDPRFHTTYVNIYLVIGSQKALLMDTGCGIFPLRPLIENIIGSKELVVINTHSHFDHRGSSDEFDEIYIHENEAKSLTMPYDLTFIQDSVKPMVKLYEKKQWKLLPAKKIKNLTDGDIFELGDIDLQVIHTPGHSIGSICLMTSLGELFTSDTAHYGTMYLPRRRDFPVMLKSIDTLIKLAKNNDSIEIYPSHEEFPVGKELLLELYDGIRNIENLWATKTKDKFLRAWLIDDGKFKYLI